MPVLPAILGVLGGAVNLVYWWWVATRGERRFRAWCERRYRVRITPVSRGFWRVDGEGSWLRRGAIGWLQLAWFMGAFVVWAVVLVAGLLATNLVS